MTPRRPSGPPPRPRDRSSATPTAERPARVTARSLAIEALLRIDEGAYANLVLPPLLERSGLDDRDRRFCTDLVYGTTRMRAACDFLVDRFLAKTDLDPPVRAALRLGAYQLHFLRSPAHAAVSETVEVAPRRARGLVNAVLRRVSTGTVEWPDEASRLSYPSWIVERMERELGGSVATRVLEAMNEPATVHRRPDGYVQDPASRDVVDLLGVRAGDVVVDVCAAPGGKSTAMASLGAFVVAGDRHFSRAGLVVENAATTGVTGRLAVLATDATRPGLRAGSADRLLVDAPCSGLGVLRRRPDARWRIDADAPVRLAALQVDLVTAAATLVRPGGRLVYAVCTLTVAETDGVAGTIDARSEELGLVADGRRLLVPDADHDGMFVARWRRT